MYLANSNDFWQIWAIDDFSFSGYCFEGVDVSEEIDAAGRVFSRSQFKHCRFYKVDLADTEWNGTIFEDVVFEDCDLRGAEFKGASGKKVFFKNCEVGGASFNKSIFVDINMMRCIGQLSMEAAYLQSFIAYACNFENGNFDDADLTGAQLVMSALRGASFIKATLNEASMAGSDLTNANLFGVVDKRNLNLNSSIISPYMNSPYIAQQTMTEIVKPIEKHAVLICGAEEELVF